MLMPIAEIALPSWKIRGQIERDDKDRPGSSPRIIPMIGTNWLGFQKGRSAMAYCEPRIPIGKVALSIASNTMGNMLWNLFLDLLNVASVAPKTLSNAAIPNTPQMFPAAKTLSSTSPMTLSWRTHRAAATIKEDAMPRLKMTDRMASTEMNDKARATLSIDSCGACPESDAARIFDSILLRVSCYTFCGTRMEYVFSIEIGTRVEVSFNI